MARFIAVLLAALYAGPALAQIQPKDSATFQVDKAGADRCIYVRDLTLPSGDKDVAIGCINSRTGAWEPPSSQVNRSEIDERTLRAYGYRGDGVARPLSSVASLNGRSTAGWTLSRWKFIFPSAASLSDTLDWVIFQSFIDANSGGYIRFKLGPGIARFNKPLHSCSQAVTIQGAGDKQTIFQYDGGVNGWNVCTVPGDTRTLNPIYLNDIGFRQTTAGNTAIGIYGKWVPGSIGGKINNVRIDNFNQAAELWSAGGWEIDHLFASSGLSAGGAVGDGLSIKGNSVFVIHIQNTQMQGFNNGYAFNVKADGGNPAAAGMEDIALRNSGAGEGRTCVLIKSDDTNYSPLHWNIENMACQAHEGFVRAEQAGALRIVGGSWIAAPPAGSWTGVGKDWFLFGRIETGVLRDAHISNNAEAMTISSYVRLANAGNFGGSAHNVTIDNNKFEYANLTATNGQIWKEFEAVGSRVMNNQFVNAWSYQALPPANAFLWVENGTGTDSLFRGAPGEVVGLTGATGVVGSTVAANVASAPLSPGKWMCSSNIWWNPSGGANMSLLQAGFNTTSGVIPLSPGFGMISEGGSWTAGVVKSLATYVFDFTTSTTNTTVYLVGLVAYSGGSVSMSNGGQCVRLR